MAEVSLAARLGRLERENLRLRVGMVAVLAVVAALVCVAATSPVQKAVRAERFEVVDSQGRSRAALDAAGVTLQREDGKIAAMLFLGTDGSPGLHLYDARGRPRARFMLRGDGAAALEQYAEDGSVIWSPPSAVLRATPPSTGRAGLYPGVGSGHWVQQNIESGHFILLEDDSLWEVSSLDRIDATLWLATESITVLDNGGGLWPYKLVNTDTGEAVEAKMVGNR